MMNGDFPLYTKKIITEIRCREKRETIDYAEGTVLYRDVADGRGEPLCPGAAVYREIADDRLYQRCKILCPQRPARGNALFAGQNLWSGGTGDRRRKSTRLAQGLKADQSLKIPVVETGVVVQKQAFSKKAKKTFDQHTVQKGETLYGISKRYAISVETIMEDNPGLDPIHLKPGSVILIRKRRSARPTQRKTRRPGSSTRIA